MKPATFLGFLLSAIKIQASAIPSAHDLQERDTRISTLSDENQRLTDQLRMAEDMLGVADGAVMDIQNKYENMRMAILGLADDVDRFLTGFSAREAGGGGGGESDRVLV